MKRLCSPSTTFCRRTVVEFRLRSSIQIDLFILASVRGVASWFLRTTYIESDFPSPMYEVPSYSQFVSNQIPLRVLREGPLFLHLNIRLGNRIQVVGIGYTTRNHQYIRFFIDFVCT